MPLKRAELFICYSKIHFRCFTKGRGFFPFSFLLVPVWNSINSCILWVLVWFMASQLRKCFSEPSLVFLSKALEQFLNTDLKIKESWQMISLCALGFPWHLVVVTSD